MRVFKTKHFARFTRKEGIDDDDLGDAIRRAASGLVDADLGGGVIKQRLARRGQGKSSGFRSIVLFRRDDRAIFAYGFAKNDRDNISRNELSAFRKLADAMLGYDETAMAAAIEYGVIVEIAYNA